MRLDVKPVVYTTRASITGSGGDEFRLNIGELTLRLDLDYAINEHLEKKIGKLLWKALTKVMQIQTQGNVKADTKFRNVTFDAKYFLLPDMKQIGHQIFMYEFIDLQFDIGQDGDYEIELYGGPRGIETIWKLAKHKFLEKMPAKIQRSLRKYVPKIVKSQMGHNYDWFEK
jgi:hypothetical protein